MNTLISRNFTHLLCNLNTNFTPSIKVLVHVTTIDCVILYRITKEKVIKPSLLPDNIFNYLLSTVF
jgi:hypothetical protein